MTFRAKLFLAIFFISVLPLAYAFGMGQFVTTPVLIAVFALCVFALLGALAGAVKVDGLLKGAEDRAFRSEVELQSFLERVHDGVFRVDEKGTIREMNTAMAEMLQHESDFLKGRCLWDFLHCDKGIPDMKFLRSGQVRCTLEMSGKAKSGRPVPLIVDLYLQKKAGQFAGFRGCAHRTKTLLAEEQLKERMASEFFRSTSGKLRQFLREIEAIMSSPQEPAVLREWLEQSTRSMRCRLAALSSEETLTDWRPELSMTPIDPSKLMDHVCFRFEGPARRRSQRIVKNCFSEGMSLNGDFHYLLELLGNLLENSLKFSKDEEEVVITYREGEDRHVFAVSDSGCGLSQAELSRVFNPFFRAENAVNARIPGMGLGLWMAQRIAEAHKGSLTVQSELGHETTFTLTIPKTVLGSSDVKWRD